VSDPVRLVEGPNVDAALLLEAWSGERPSGDARRRAMALAASIGAGAAVGSATTAKVATTASKLALIKWIVAGVIAASAAAAIGIVATRGGASSPGAAATPAAAATIAPAAPAVDPPAAPAAPAAPAEKTVRVLTPGELPSAKAEALPSARSATATTTTPRPDDDARGASVARELEAVDRARAAVRRGDGDGALAVLDAFDAEFPKSSLADEVVVIRIDALVRTGRTARAAELARAFVARKPASPYAARLRTIAERETTNP
jgi:hypothetical protein